MPGRLCSDRWLVPPTPDAVIDWGLAPQGLLSACIFNEMGPSPVEHVRDIRMDYQVSAGQKWTPQGVRFNSPPGGTSPLELPALSINRVNLHLFTVAWGQMNGPMGFGGFTELFGNTAIPLSTIAAPARLVDDPIVRFHYPFDTISTGNFLAVPAKRTLINTPHSLMASVSTGVTIAANGMRLWDDGTQIGLFTPLLAPFPGDAMRRCNSRGVFANPVDSQVRYWYIFNRYITDDALARQLHAEPFFFFATNKHPRYIY